MAQRRGLGTDSKMAPGKTSFFTSWIRKQVAHEPRFPVFPLNLSSALANRKDKREGRGREKGDGAFGML